MITVLFTSDNKRQSYLAGLVLKEYLHKFNLSNVDIEVTSARTYGEEQVNIESLFYDFVYELDGESLTEVQELVEDIVLIDILKYLDLKVYGELYE